MAKEEENLNIFPEEQEEREQISRGTSINNADEIRAAEIAEECQNEPMGGWQTLAYLHEFYPELPPDFALKVMQIIREMEQEENGVQTFDIRKIKEAVANDKEIMGEKALESLENCAIMDFMLRKAVPEILKDRPEDHLKVLDVGGGPTIYQHLALMGLADSITHSEFLKDNREEVLRWKAGQSEFDWSSFFVTLQSYLKTHPEISQNGNDEVRARFAEFAAKPEPELENNLREKIAQVLPVDVFKEDLALPEEKVYDMANISKDGSVELLTSNFCIESAGITDPEMWRRGIENVTSKVSKNGFLLMTAIRNAHWYKVGDSRMDAVPVNAGSLRAELERQGFEIRVISEVVGSEQEVVGYDGMVFVLAQKMK